MEIRIGVVHTPKEITLELEGDADEVKKAVERSEGSVTDAIRRSISATTSSTPAPERKAAKADTSAPAAKPAAKVAPQDKVIEVTVTPRKPIVPAGQPLPPQPSAN